MKKSRIAAFTLVESLVALFILSLALTGGFVVITSNLNNANFIKHSFIASGLAQEGLEVVRNLRDTDWFGTPPKSFGAFGAADGLPVPDGTYRVQWNSSELLSLGTNPFLSQDAYGMYGYDVVTRPSIFSRTIEIKSVRPASGPIVEIIVKVTVTWQERVLQKQLVAEEHLFNWY